MINRLKSTLLNVHPPTAAWLIERRDEAVWRVKTGALALRNRRRPFAAMELANWLDEAHTLGCERDLAGRKVLVFSFLSFWTDTCVATASVLVARGCDVTFAFLPYDGYEAPDPPLSVERLRARYTRILRPRERARGLDLQTLPRAPITPAVDEELARLAYVDTQYIARVEDVDVGGAEREVYEYRLSRLREAFATLTTQLGRERYDVLLTPNGGILEYGAAVLAADKAGVEPTTFEYWERNRTCAAVAGRSCFRSMASELWEATPHVLDPERRARVARVLAQKENADWSDFVFACQSAPSAGADELRRSLALREGRPVVLVCPNVPYDAAFLGADGPFKTMAAWLRATLAHLAPRSDVEVIVRAHPGERLLTPKQTAATIVRDALPELPPHVHFIGPEAKVNTYDLMRLADVGLVFSSTTGLEMAMRGIPVIVTVPTHYADKGFCTLARTPDDFARALDGLLAAAPARLPREQVELAWCYQDVFQQQWPRPFPWGALTLAKDLHEWPLARILSAEGDRFRDAFTILAGGAEAQRLMREPSRLLG